ncbi:MAG: class I mannose-6-phosphate isomerase [Bacilli bacterium]|nr:class I mannose-6-phosphate isomerase [Bacilli bacterium]MDD4077722.1 class I mannose-6-phosphate isomerase [Bacilli bacterium]MDD4388739.1 class I mannose-6-phosphate isomerase [Bacilli bacterium]
MKYLKFKSEYDRNPINIVKGYDHHIFDANEIIKELRKYREGVLVFEIYPGVHIDVFKTKIIEPLDPDLLINIEDYTKTELEINEMLAYNLTDDRVFGIMSHHTIEDFYSEKNIGLVQEKVKSVSGLRIVYGFGASLIEYDYLVYVDITRWEIQLRYRKGMTNFKTNNPNEDTLRKYKRGYFVEWRVADRIKKNTYKSLDYVIDGSTDDYVMITKDAYDAALHLLTTKPFRLVPYFDPGVWGGQWMKEVCNLEENGSNYAWSFDGVPEENSLKFSFGGKIIELPALNLVFFRAPKLLGERVYGRFGTDYPIRFDFLDTVEGGNLSLQVHPLTEYIQDKFGIHYTQDESYYILYAEEDSVVYLGVKPDINPERMIEDLERANRGEIVFDDEKYINKFPVKTHDHILIPGGTIHCSGKNTMVLEISTSSYIFTFKLWDWGRIGLDGRPRPVHINHGKESIQFERNTEWVKKNLINRFEKINKVETRTGLHEREFIETRRFFFNKKIKTKTEGSFNMLNLVEGAAAVIESPTNQFEPFTVHYAETFIIPENVKEYTIRPREKKMKCGVIKAYVR